VAHELGERLAVRLGQDGAANVPAEVEAGVVDPEWVRQAGGAAAQALAIARDEMQAVLDALVAHPVAVLEQQQAADGHVHGADLGRERGAVSGGEVLRHCG
jgi:hypothetical protein